MALRYVRPSTLKTDRSTQRGAGLLVVLLLLMLLLAFTSAVVLSLQSGLKRGNHRERGFQASHVCESGLQMALKNIQKNGGELIPNPYLDVLPGHPELAFRVEADKNLGSTPRVSAFGEISIPPGHIDLKTTAIIHGKEVPGNIGRARQLAAQAELKFEHGLFETNTKLDFFSTSFRIDSYDPTAGIAPFENPMPAVPPNENRQASIRAAGTLDLGDGLLCGDAYMFGPQPGVNYTPANLGPTQLTGLVKDAVEYTVPIQFQKPELYLGVTPAPPPAASPDLRISPGSYGDAFYFGVRDITLESGVYYFDSLQFSGGPTVRLDLDYAVDGTADPVVIYVAHDAIFDAVVNMTPVSSSVPRLPRAIDLQLYLLDEPGPGSEVSTIGMFSATRFRGVVAGGRSILDMNNGARMYGAYTVGDAWIDFDILMHQDVSLASEEPAGETMWVLYHEIGN